MYDAPRRERASVRELPPRTSPSAAGWIALVIWAVFGILAVLGTVGVVAAFSRYTNDLTPPSDLLKELSFSQQSRITDRNGVELARFGGEKREVVDLRRHPADRRRRPGCDRGQDLLGQRRLRPARDRLGRHRQPARQQPRRVDDHPAARPPAPPRPDPRPGPEPDVRAEDQGDHPVDPADRGVPGRRRQAADHHRLPEPELLRQPDLRREGRGRDLLRARPDWTRKIDAGPGRDPRRAREVALELRPRPERGVLLPGRQGGSQRPGEVPRGDDPRGSPGRDDRGRAATRSWTSSRAAGRSSRRTSTARPS